MRVLFLTKYPPQGASSRYRVYQYLPYLEQAGIECRVQSFMDERLYRLTFTPGRRLPKVWSVGWAIIRRTWCILRIPRPDIVYMQRELLPFGPLWLERWMIRRGAKLVYDYDDALFLFKPSKHNRFADRFRPRERIFDIWQTVDTVIAGNPWLAEKAGEYCADSRYFPVAEDLERLTPKADYAIEPGQPLVIGWLGSPTTEKYLNLIADALQAVVRLHPHLPIQIQIVGGDSFAAEGLDVVHIPWSHDAEPALVRRFDIGIMPLPLEEWSKGKCGGKARTYMACGLPAVCSNIGYNQHLIEHGISGMLATTTQDWVDALSPLIASAGERGRLGRGARRSVKEHYDLRAIGPRFADLLKDIANG